VSVILECFSCFLLGFALLDELNQNRAKLHQRLTEVNVLRRPDVNELPSASSTDGQVREGYNNPFALASLGRHRRVTVTNLRAKVNALLE
jgi:hypothetical protein